MSACCNIRIDESVVTQEMRPTRRVMEKIAFVLALSLLPGCAWMDALRPEPDRVVIFKEPPKIDVAVYRRAEVDRSSQLEAEVERLRADLRRAEEALVLVESNLSGAYTRADAVSSLAEARIEVERVGARVPWRSDEIAEAQRKLDEAELQIDQSHFGAALFFVYRARRIADLAALEARLVAERPNTLFVASEKVNLRVGPSMRDAVVRVLSEGTPVFPEKHQAAWVLVRHTSGSVGWIHKSLLR